MTKYEYEKSGIALNTGGVDERWGSNKTTVATKVEFKRDVFKTEKQWAKNGFVPIDDKVGRFLWTTQNCDMVCRYLLDTEVKKVTK